MINQHQPLCTRNGEHSERVATAYVYALCAMHNDGYPVDLCDGLHIYRLDDHKGCLTVEWLDHRHIIALEKYFADAWEAHCEPAENVHHVCVRIAGVKEVSI